MAVALWGLMSLAGGIATAFSVAPNPLDVGKAIILPPNAASKAGSVTITNAAALLPDGQVLITGGWLFSGGCADPCVSSSGCEAVEPNHAELYHP
jgi:hypothetical protein